MIQEWRERLDSGWFITSTASFSVLMFFPVNNLQHEETKNHYVDSIKTKTLQIKLLHAESLQTLFESKQRIFGDKVVSLCRAQAGTLAFSTVSRDSASEQRS